MSDERRNWTQQRLQVALNTTSGLSAQRAVVLQAYDETEAELLERRQAVKQASEAKAKAEIEYAARVAAEDSAVTMLRFAKQKMVSMMYKDEES